MRETGVASPREGSLALQVAAPRVPCAPEPPTPDLRPPARSLSAASTNIRNAIQAAHRSGGGGRRLTGSGAWRVQPTTGGVSVCSTGSDAGDSCAPSTDQDLDADEKEGSVAGPEPPLEEQEQAEGEPEEAMLQRLRAQHLRGFDLDGLQPAELCEVIAALTQAVERVRQHVERRSVAVRNRHRQWPLAPEPKLEVTARRSSISWRRPASPTSSPKGGGEDPMTSPQGAEPMTFAALREAMSRIHESPRSSTQSDAGFQHRRGQSLPGLPSLRLGSLAAVACQAGRAPSPLGLAPGQALSSAAGSDRGSELDETSPRSVSSGAGVPPMGDARGRRVAVSRQCSTVVMEELQRRSALNKLYQNSVRHR